jgi:hypothetical protein
VWSRLPDDTFERVARAAGSRLDAPATLEDAAERVTRTARSYELCAIVDDDTFDEQTRADAWRAIDEL